MERWCPPRPSPISGYRSRGLVQQHPFRDSSPLGLPESSKEKYREHLTPPHMKASWRPIYLLCLQLRGGLRAPFSGQIPQHPIWMHTSGFNLQVTGDPCGSEQQKSSSSGLAMEPPSQLQGNLINGTQQCLVENQQGEGSWILVDLAGPPHHAVDMDLPN